MQTQLTVRNIVNQVHETHIEEQPVEVTSWLRIEMHDAQANQYVTFLSPEVLASLAPNFPNPVPDIPLKPKHRRKSTKKRRR